MGKRRFKFQNLFQYFLSWFESQKNLWGGGGKSAVVSRKLLKEVQYFTNLAPLIYS